MEERKKEHLQLAVQSQVSHAEQDARFTYEPMLSAHPTALAVPFTFLGKVLQAPFWVSSMTGGTGMAKSINVNLAKACHEFGLGMGLGSCRAMLENPKTASDFDVRDIIGPNLPLYANIGISQLEQLVEQHSLNRLSDLISELRADGLIVHVNPLQEWFQPEGDSIKHPPITTISHLLSECSYPVIVKEVGQGMGYQSLSALLRLPLAAVEFAALGGTNFPKLELLRKTSLETSFHSSLVRVGHTASEMVDMVNQIALHEVISCREIIISGGVADFLDGYYLTQKSKLPSVVGLASTILKHAHDYEQLRAFLSSQIKGYRLAQAYLKIRE